MSLAEEIKKWNLDIFRLEQSKKLRFHRSGNIDKFYQQTCLMLPNHSLCLWISQFLNLFRVTLIENKTKSTLFKK